MVIIVAFVRFLRLDHELKLDKTYFSILVLICKFEHFFNIIFTNLIIMQCSDNKMQKANFMITCSGKFVIM